MAIQIRQTDPDKMVEMWEYAEGKLAKIPEHLPGLLYYTLKGRRATPEEALSLINRLSPDNFTIDGDFVTVTGLDDLLELPESFAKGGETDGS